MTIEELCVKLQQKRNTLGLTLEEVVEKTKLYPSIIRDIESGNLGNISQAYLKGYMRIYASFLGVAIEDALEKIRPDNAPKMKPIVKEEEDISEKKPKSPRKPIPPYVKKIVFYVIAAIFVLWVLTGFIRFISKSISKLPKQTAKKPPQVAAKIPVVSRKSQNAVSASLRAKRDCFIRAKVDGKVLFEGVLKKGASENWKGNREIEFKISDGSSVYLEVNGKSLPSLTSAHKSIKSLKVNSSGISIVK